MTYHTIPLFGFDFISAKTHSEFLDHLINYQNNPNYNQKLPFVVTPNADQLVKLDKPQYQSLKKTLSQAMFILPDGQSIVLFSYLVRRPLKARLTGSDLFPLVWQQAKQNQQKILVIVSTEEVGLKLKQDYDSIIYYVPPFFEINTPSFEKIGSEAFDIIKKFSPDYIITGVSFPKQEYLSLALYQKLKEQNISLPLFLFLGASAEFYVGIKKRAPLFFQRVGLEWFYRLLQEPRRMWKRYILGSVSLFFLFLKEMKKEFFGQKF